MDQIRPYFIEDIRRQVQATSHEQRMRASERTQLRKNSANDLFRIKSADQWLQDEHGNPAARQLMGSLWYENEICILFADTNIGKSILAVQIGFNIGKNCHMEPFAYQLPEAEKVLYVDFELSAQQFKARYTHPYHGLHHFGDNFYRAEFNPAGDNSLLYDKYDVYVRDEIEASVVKTKAKVLIIDNITSLGSATSYANAALPLMKSLKAMKAKHQLSILVLAHTPKRRSHQPITVNDLQGSKMLINFADSAFAIGQSRADPTLRYIKQIKQRNTGNVHGAEHVCLFRISKELSFLGFEFVDYDHEQAHLQKNGSALSEEMAERVIELDRQGLSLRQIAGNLKVGRSTVIRVLKRMKQGAVVNETAAAESQ